LLPEIEKLVELRILNASANQFTGQIPSELLKLKKLTTLRLADNQLSGNLPASGSPISLQVLDVSSNKLDGSLPAWLRDVSHLAALNLRGNSFTGGLLKLEEVETLRNVDLRDNSWLEPISKKLEGLQRVGPFTDFTAAIDADLLQNDDSPTPNVAGQPGFVPSTIDMPQSAGSGQNLSALVGVVTDQTGAVLPGVVVTATSNSGTRTAITDGSGHYQLSLPPGIYRISYASAGFMQKVQDNVQVGQVQAQSLDMTMAVGVITELVDVTAEAAPSGPWWNTWITNRGAPEQREESFLETDGQYSFYLELSAAAKQVLKSGYYSTQLDPDLRERLSDLILRKAESTYLSVRIAIVGRAVTLSEEVGSSALWSSGAWVNGDGPTSTATVKVDLARLLPHKSGQSYSELSGPFALRGAGLMFGLKAVEPGCAAIAISIWDESRSVPLDHLVRMVSVGHAQECGGEIEEQETGRTIYSAVSAGISSDVSLQVFNFKFNGTTHSASFMAIQHPTGQCQNFSWSSDATLTELVSNSAAFRSELDDARKDEGVYASIGDQLSWAVFPTRRHIENCGSAEAFKALVDLTHDRDVRLFARISDENGRLLILPLGLLAMSQDNGQRVFAHDIRVFQPMARETLSSTDCVGSWTFVLPSQLKGFPPNAAELIPPPPLDSDPRVIRSRQEFLTRFSGFKNDNDNPTGLLLLAHHQDGLLTFSGSGDSLVYTKFDKRFGEGSIAILSACETANLSTSTKLVDRFNDLGVDGLIAASFELEMTFGIHFAFSFAKVVSESKGESITLEDAFTKAVTAASSELAQTTSTERARGMGLEMVLVGNPRLKICVPARVAP
jgi:hypothetical protein